MTVAIAMIPSAARMSPSGPVKPSGYRDTIANRLSRGLRVEAEFATQKIRGFSRPSNRFASVTVGLGSAASVEPTRSRFRRFGGRHEPVEFVQPRDRAAPPEPTSVISITGDLIGTPFDVFADVVRVRTANRPSSTSAHLAVVPPYRKATTFSKPATARMRPLRYTPRPARLDEDDRLRTGALGRQDAAVSSPSSRACR